MRLAGLAGLVLAALGWVLEPPVFASAWRAGFAVWLGWPLGSLALLLVHRLTGGSWGEALAPGLLLGVRGLWLLLPAALPLLLTPHPALGIDGFAAYQAPPFLAVRFVLYLVAWLGLGGVVLRAASRGGVNGGLAVLGLALLAVTVTFAAIDLTMILQPGFQSSAYGLGAIAGALSLAAATAILAEGGAPAAGGLLLALALLWGYLDFVPFLIVVESDLPTDAPWYASRLQGGWQMVTVAVSALHMALPALTLLSGRMRRSPAVLTGLAVLLVVGAVLRGWWVVLPATPRGLSWVDFACLLAFAGCSLALPGAKTVPRHA